MRKPDPSEKDHDQPSVVAARGEKLQKVLARVGLGSRRALEHDIVAGDVKVNGQVAKLGDRVEAKDTIEYKGKRVRVDAAAEEPRVLLYNKPEGEICTSSDPEGRRTVFDRLPHLHSGRWIQVGRLDINTSGLLLFTNHGELANRLMHPSSNIDREYLVRVRGKVGDQHIKNMLSGVELDDGMAKFMDIVESPNNEEGQSYQWFYCVVMEGRNREVRRLWESQGVQVTRLKRVRFGHTFIPSHVRVGQWIEFDDKEMAGLFKTAGLDAPKKRLFKPRVKEQRERHIKKLRAAPKRTNKRPNKRR